MNGGYVMVDGKGLDLTSNESQTITGLFKDLDNAIKTGKPVFGYNCVWGVNNDKPLSPLPIFLQKWNDDLIVGTCSILNVNITSSDVVTIDNLTT